MYICTFFKDFNFERNVAFGKISWPPFERQPSSQIVLYSYSVIIPSTRYLISSMLATFLLVYIEPCNTNIRTSNWNIIWMSPVSYVCIIVAL